MAGLAAPAGQDAARGDHAMQVVRVGLAANQDDVLAAIGPLHRGRRVKYGLADRRAWRSADRLGDQRRARAVAEPGKHQLRELRALDPAQGLVNIDEAL